VVVVGGRLAFSKSDASIGKPPYVTRTSDVVTLSPAGTSTPFNLKVSGSRWEWWSFTWRMLRFIATPAAAASHGEGVGVGPWGIGAKPGTRA
jgi:hypothetical protein